MSIGRVREREREREHCALVLADGAFGVFEVGVDEELSSGLETVLLRLLVGALGVGRLRLISCNFFSTSASVLPFLECDDGFLGMEAMVTDGFKRKVEAGLTEETVGSVVEMGVTGVAGVGGGVEGVRGVAGVRGVDGLEMGGETLAVVPVLVMIVLT